MEIGQSFVYAAQHSKYLLFFHIFAIIQQYYPSFFLFAYRKFSTEREKMIRETAERVKNFCFLYAHLGISPNMWPTRGWHHWCGRRAVKNGGKCQAMMQMSYYSTMGDNLNKGTPRSEMQTKTKMKMKKSRGSQTIGHTQKKWNMKKRIVFINK